MAGALLDRVTIKKLVYGRLKAMKTAETSLRVLYPWETVPGSDDAGDDGNAVKAIVQLVAVDVEGMPRQRGLASAFGSEPAYGRITLAFNVIVPEFGVEGQPTLISSESWVYRLEHAMTAVAEHFSERSIVDAVNHPGWVIETEEAETREDDLAAADGGDAAGLRSGVVTIAGTASRLSGNTATQTPEEIGA